eukprot:Sdes_comp16538_c0_seq1m5850
MEGAEKTDSVKTNAGLSSPTRRSKNSLPSDEFSQVVSNAGSPAGFDENEFQKSPDAQTSSEAPLDAQEKESQRLLSLQLLKQKEIELGELTTSFKRKLTELYFLENNMVLLDHFPSKQYADPKLDSFLQVNSLENVSKRAKVRQSSSSIDVTEPFSEIGTSEVPSSSLTSAVTAGISASDVGLPLLNPSMASLPSVVPEEKSPPLAAKVGILSSLKCLGEDDQDLQEGYTKAIREADVSLQINELKRRGVWNSKRLPLLHQAPRKKC